MTVDYEVERKFLVKNFNNILLKEEYRELSVAQGYFSDEDIRVEVLLEKPVDSIYSITKDNIVKVSIGAKLPTENPLIRLEEEHKFNKDFAISFLEACKNQIVFKTRWWIPIDNHIWELDKYYGKLSGLFIAEIESDIYKIEELEVPDFCFKEVTSDDKFKNKNLAKLNNLKSLNLKNILKCGN